MFEDKRAQFVLGQVCEHTLAVRMENAEIELDDIRSFPTRAVKNVTDYHNAVYVFLGKYYPGDNNPEYLRHIIDHSYHVEEMSKRVTLVEKLYPRIDCPNPDTLALWRIIGAMAFVYAELQAMEQQLFFL